jgi:site-specific DNA-methyltransferase (adenine-specific)
LSQGPKKQRNGRNIAQPEAISRRNPNGGAVIKPNWTLHQGDCLPYLRSLPDQSIDLLVTDPPYCSGGSSARTRAQDPKEKYAVQRADVPSFEGDTLDQRAFLTWCGLWLAEAKRLLKPGAAIVCFIDWRQYPTLSDAIQIAGFIWRGAAAWDKTEGRARPAPIRAQCEYLLWGTKGEKSEHLKKTCVPGAFRQMLPSDERKHLTPKPISVLRQLVQLAPSGGVVLDPFTGGGSTGLAALQEGRSFVGCELSPHYAQVARERLTALAPEASPENSAAKHGVPA